MLQESSPQVDGKEPRELELSANLMAPVFKGDDTPSSGNREEAYLQAPAL